MFSRNLLVKAFIVLFAFIPAVALAQTYSTPNIWKVPPGYWGPIVSCSGEYSVTGSSASASSGSLPPCKNLCDLINTTINAIYLAMSVALFILAPILFVVGGIMIMISGANPEMLSRGKKTLIDTLIGLIIVLCSYLIVNTVITALKINGIGGFGASSCTTASQ
jgi:hypothetical protein